MRAVIQKVSHAHIAAADAPDAPFSQIPHGLCVLLGVGGEDSEADARYIAAKCCWYRNSPSTATPATAAAPPSPKPPAPNRPKHCISK